MDTTGQLGIDDRRILPRAVRLLRKTFGQWLEDKAPQLGAALAYYTVFSLAPMILVLLAVFGLIYGNSEVARREILHQLYSFLDRSSAKAVEDIAASAGRPTASLVATLIGIAVALFGASGVFGQLQDALNTIWGVKPKPGKSFASFLRARFLSFAMVAGVCFLILVSLTASAVITALGGYIEQLIPGGSALAWTIHLALDIGIVTMLFAMIFKFLPDARLSWRDVRLDAALTIVVEVPRGLLKQRQSDPVGKGITEEAIALDLARDVALKTASPFPAIGERAAGLYDGDPPIWYEYRHRVMNQRPCDHEERGTRAWKIA